MQKRLALLFVAAFFLLALIPAFYPADNDLLSPDSPFTETYGQLFAAVTTSYSFSHDVSWV